MSGDDQRPGAEWSGGERPEEEQVGSVADEAAKLFGALSDLARDRGTDLGATMAGLAGHAAEALRDVDEHVATGAEECRYCPLCRTVHAVRQTSPEVRAHLASAAGSLLQAVAGMLATDVPPPARADGVERIDLHDDWADDVSVNDSDNPEEPR